MKGELCFLLIGAVVGTIFIVRWNTSNFVSVFSDSAVLVTSEFQTANPPLNPIRKTLDPSPIPSIAPSLTTSTVISQTLNPSPIPSFTPSLTTSTVISLSESRCSQIIIQSKRPVQPWIWPCADGNVSEPQMEKALPNDFPWHKYSNDGVISINDDNWGQLCNKMGILSGALVRMQIENQTHRFLALNPIWSEIFWYMDLPSLSNTSLPGILLDCVTCESDPKQIRCLSLLLPGGKLFALDSSIVFDVFAQYPVFSLYVKYRPRNRGFSPYIVHNFVPKLFLQRQVLGQVQEFIQRSKDTVLVGIHRRTMDHMCLPYAQDRLQYNCFLSPELYKEADAIAVDLANKEIQNMSLLEKNHPFLMACNYTLTSPGQIEHMVVPYAGNNRINVLLASDELDKQGDEALATSPVVANVFQLNMSCFTSHKYQTMLADMVALSATPIHLENPLSSCGNLVAQWRTNLFSVPRYSSFPRMCYDDFYDKHVRDL